MSIAHPAHLRPDLMAKAQRALLRKAIAEAAHERMITPDEVSPGHFRLGPDSSAYSFDAQVLSLDHWSIDAASIEHTVDGTPVPPDACDFVVEYADRLGIPDDLLPTYLEELSSTLAAACWKLHHRAIPAADLVDSDFQTIERAMTEGHPAFIANNGRIGFDDRDHAAYSPESGAPVRLLWIAVRRDLGHLALGEGLSEEQHYLHELGEEWLARAKATLSDLDLEPADYLFAPVHPWQWHHKLAITFATDLARHDLVLLGEGPDEHQAQQSIRTFYNLDDESRSYTKVALSIQNMGFLRGLSPAYMRRTPEICDWVAGVVRTDAELEDLGFDVLREHASVGYTGDAYHAQTERTGTRTAYTKMIAGLWRESPHARLREGERLASMTSLLHRDADGASVASALITASGLEAQEWVRRYLRAYVRPIVHCLARYDLAFMPHGENVILVLEDHAPTRMLMKDIGEEVALLGRALPIEDLPAGVQERAEDLPADLRVLAVFTDVFDGFLRFLAAILHEDGTLDHQEFWREVGRCLEEHAADHPELAYQLAGYDFTRPSFRHSCLNRLQLRNTLAMVDIEDQAESLMFAGELANPIAHRPG